MESREPEIQRDKEAAARLTSAMLHKHYDENDVDAVTASFADPFSWVGAGEEEYCTGLENVLNVFRQFAGKVPKCNLTDEHYDVIEVADGIYVCSGRLWVTTDPSTNIYLRVHQRITTVFRKIDGELKCNHLHLSNPYVEMVPGDVGFPTAMAKHSYDYLQGCLKEKQREIDSQSMVLNSIYDTVPCSIIRFARKHDGAYELLFANRGTADLMGISVDDVQLIDWSAGYCPFMDEADAKRLADLMEGLRVPGDQASAVCQVRRQGGDAIYVNSINTFISSDERGDIIQKIVFDITERIMVEKSLARMIYEDGLTHLYNRTKFSQELDDESYADVEQLGIAYFDINGLKAMNDQKGHAAGDDLICRTARHISEAFSGSTYRIGGDEFVVIDSKSDEDEFRSQVDLSLKLMHDDDIEIAVGCSWRSKPCSILEQFDEADRLMYRDKSAFYSSKLHDRRRRQ